MAQLNFYPGFPDELEDAEGLRKTAALRVRAANMFAAGDGINQAVLSVLLNDAETMLEGCERSARRMPLAFEPTALPPLSAVAEHAHAILNAMSVADFSDKQDRAALEELMMGLANALDRHAEGEAPVLAAARFNGVAEVAAAQVISRVAKSTKRSARGKSATA